VALVAQVRLGRGTTEVMEIPTQAVTIQQVEEGEQVLQVLHQQLQM
jgi:hypothetical protein